MDEDRLNLFETVWPRSRARITLADRLGWRWGDVSAPFLKSDRGRLLAHVGVLELPVRIGGQDSLVASIHAVCTRPGFRSRGLATELMAQALAGLDLRGIPVQLSTDIPAFYEPMGFEELHLSRFRLDVAAGPPHKPMRPLSDRRADDVRLVRAALESRMPVSEIWSVRDSGWLLPINEVLTHGGFRRFGWCEPAETLVVWELVGDTLRLLDLVFARVPDLSVILATMPGGWTSVESCVHPDRFEVPFEAVDANNPETFMVRGQQRQETSAVSPLWMT